MKDATTVLDPETGPVESEKETGKMSFLEHLDELRKRLVHIVTYIGVGFLVCWFFSKPIYDFLALPITKALPDGTKLAFTNPTDPFTLYMKVAFIAAIFLTLPFTLYEVWKFIAPGLYVKEKKYVVPFLFSSVLLFVLGGAFCYYIVLPAAYGFLIQLGSSFQPVIKINEYLDLTNTMLLGFGLVFEMPVIVAFLALFGLVSAKFLWDKFKFAMVIIVAVAAILSPTGDAFNLLIWSAPMIVLYILSIGVAAIFGWRRRKSGMDQNS
jgi:sec-independent protein translocase protein TatC